MGRWGRCPAKRGSLVPLRVPPTPANGRDARANPRDSKGRQRRRRHRALQRTSRTDESFQAKRTDSSHRPRASPLRAAWPKISLPRSPRQLQERHGLGRDAQNGRRGGCLDSERCLRRRSVWGTPKTGAAEDAWIPSAASVEGRASNLAVETSLCTDPFAAIFKLSASTPATRVVQPRPNAFHSRNPSRKPRRSFE
jgi:hypothetical protein